MKTAQVAAGLLLAGSALAVPATIREQMKEKRAARRGLKNNWKTGTPLAVGHKSMNDRVIIRNSTNAQYDSNWAGAVITTTGVTEVVGTWTVPDVSSGGNGGSSGAAIWVGIDGDSCQSAILQTGVSMTISNGQAAYSGWYEWYPNPSYGYSGFTVNAGDQVTARVVSTSTVSGTAYLENLSTGQSVSKSFTNMGSVGSLCNADAEWIVEDFEENGSLVSFADFGDVSITGSSYISNGNTEGVSGATILDVKNSNGQVVTNCGTSGSSTVYCDYTGPT